ncbi:MAG: hypothetical protein CFE23_12595 [Flavobacterium sp. BFFFF1]|uniref:helix-turn-helix domain-containing protein n=1 Tax=Flavobacterium sp. BFFFF1 TaxID=2015557 RepID=UPI000BCE7668|nr:helix-turn-helix domain-containing protein [Flavobacterium sp. BFFFF1]OYU79737.1 MAG: hypothetical protein CFE23_12595 [Flavobacterium sp. BFFFF1]
MNKESIREKLLKNSKVDKDWIKEAKARVQNEEDLDVAFSIAVKILRAMKTKNLSQKQLGELFDVSPQYISKLLKGKQNLTINSANKFGRLLGIKLLEVPKDFDVQPKKVIFKYIYMDHPVEISKLSSYARNQPKPYIAQKPTEMRPSNHNLKHFTAQQLWPQKNNPSIHTC